MGTERAGSRSARRRQQLEIAARKREVQSGRRDFLRTAAKWGGGSALVVTGLWAALSALKGQEKFGRDIPDVAKYYPELGNLPVNEAGSFVTGVNNLPVNWVNFTGSHFDSTSAMKFFSYFETISRNQISGSFIAQDEQQRVNFMASPNFLQLPISIFITPEDSPNPSWSGDEQGVTYRGYGNSVNLTRVSLAPAPSDQLRELFPSNEANANNIFAIETCQNSVIVRSDPQEFTRASQEAFCVSVGLAITLRQANAPYSEYSGFIDMNSFSVPINGITSYLSFIRLSEEKYFQIPVIPPVISPH